MIRTVTGDITGEHLGAFDYHEHLFQKSPLLLGDELEDERLSGEEAASFHEAGIDWFVEATPTALGANPAAVARISLATGLNVLHTSGAHHFGHYGDGHPLTEMSVQALVDQFSGDVTEGFTNDQGLPLVTEAGTPIRAGLVKAGIRYWTIGSFERRVLDAVAMVSSTTGCAVMVHLDYGSGTHEVLDLLAAGGVNANRVVLAHIDRNLDAGLHASLAERGAYLGYDGMARHREAPDSAIIDCLEAVISAAGPNRIVLGGDVARASRYRAYGGIPGLDYLPRRFMPRLESVLDASDYQAVTALNGRDLLAFTPPA